MYFIKENTYCGGQKKGYNFPLPGEGKLSKKIDIQDLIEDVKQYSIYF